jgi:predicted Holliday junction resolvase-like endonuclease
MFREWQKKITQNSIEVDAETKESTRKTEENLDGRYKEGRPDHEHSTAITTI